MCFLSETKRNGMSFRLWTTSHPQTFQWDRDVRSAEQCTLWVFKLIPFTWKDIRCSRMLIYWNGIQLRPPDGWNGPAALTSIPLWPHDFGTEMLSTCVLNPVQEWTSDLHQSYLFQLFQVAAVHFDILWFTVHTACFVFESPTLSAGKVLQSY